MFQADKIATNLVGIVGFKQPYNPAYAILDVDNLASTSGLYVNDNSYAKIEYIKDNQDYKDISDEDFNILLKDLQKSSIVSVCNQVFNEYDFVDRNVLYKYALNKVNTEVLPDGFIGYKIEVSNDKNTAVTINRVILEFQGIGDLTLLLYNTGKIEPIATKEVTIASDSQIEVLNWILNNSETTYKGDYYIGYISTGLTVAPYKRDWNMSNIMSTFKEVSIESILVDGHNGLDLFDLNLVDGLSQNVGLNLDISVYDDYTDFITNNSFLFAKAISLDLTIKCLQMYVASLRSNSNERKAQELYQKIMIEIEGSKGSDSVISVVGLREKVLGEISLLKQEVKKMRIGFLKTRQVLVHTMQ